MLFLALAITLTAIGPDRLERFPSLCLHRAVYGPSSDDRCPGCGTTRALAALGRGDVVRAHRYHAAVVPIALLLTIATLGWRPRGIGRAHGAPATRQS